MGPRELLEQFARQHPGVRAGQMFGRPGLYAGRRLFACLLEDGLIVRLPGEAARAALKAGATPFERNGRPTRDWVAYRGRAAADARRLQPLLEVAARFVAEQATRKPTR